MSLRDRAADPSASAPSDLTATSIHHLAFMRFGAPIGNAADLLGWPAKQVQQPNDR
ncbi:hypothetical protein [Allorhodopirellula heiligendammensis]|uniref:hypothetical protein n=1 Tax=Allorhodopirellula heiligendammensis TaxID=2714739 RepID=UPI00265DAC4D|nr:hypothetical protein [Allorhodopirellula heiligendammensis]